MKSLNLRYWSQWALVVTILGAPLARADNVATCLENGGDYNDCSADSIVQQYIRYNIRYCQTSSRGNKRCQHHNSQQAYAKCDYNDQKQHWYWTANNGKQLACKSIFVSGTEAAEGCRVRIKKSSCPFLKAGKVTPAPLNASSSTTKTYYFNDLAELPMDVDQLAEDVNQEVAVPDPGTTVDGTNWRSFATIFEQTGATHDYSDGKGRTEFYWNFGTGNPTTAGKTDLILNRKVNGTVPSNTMRADIITRHLRSTQNGNFRDMSCNSQPTPQAKRDCCKAREDYWERFCTLKVVKVKKKKPPTGSDPRDYIDVKVTTTKAKDVNTSYIDLEI
ncbi:MAG: hypothetical protein AB7P04_06560 [Bacteriovoracia bacterium]